MNETEWKTKNGKQKKTKNIVDKSVGKNVNETELKTKKCKTEKQKKNGKQKYWTKCQ